jgi:hypothetical protein
MNTKIPKGANIRFITEFLAAHPDGCTWSEVRNALCLARGKDPKALRGQYCEYFKGPMGPVGVCCRGPAALRPPENRWVRTPSPRGQVFKLTEAGWAWLEKDRLRSATWF